MHVVATRGLQVVAAAVFCLLSVYYGYLYWDLFSHSIRTITFRSKDCNSTRQLVIDKLEKLAIPPQLLKNESSTYDEAMWNADKQNNARLEYGILKYLNNPSGRRLHFAAAGTSITTGHSLPAGGEYVTRLSKMLEREWKIGNDTAVKLDNIAMGATGSRHFALCIAQHVDLTDLDVLFIEFLVNDDTSCAVEELIRSVWRINPFVHIVYVHMTIPKLFYLGNWGKVEKTDFEIVQHYQLPAIQWKHLLPNANNLTVSERQVLARQYSSPDFNHPAKIIHQYVADFILEYLQRTAMRLLQKLQNDDVCIDDLLNGYENAIISNWIDLEKNALFPVTNWLDGVDCFLTLNRPEVKKTDRLRSAIIATSENDDTGPIYPNQWTRPFRSMDEGSRMMYMSMPKSGSWMEFNLDTSSSSPQPKCLFVPRLAFEHSLCAEKCKPGEILIQAKFNFANGNVLSQNYNIALNRFVYNGKEIIFANPAVNATSVVTASSTNVITIQERAVFCGASSNNEGIAIKSVHLRLEQASKNDCYPFLFQAIILAYDCC